MKEFFQKLLADCLDKTGVDLEAYFAEALSKDHKLRAILARALSLSLDKDAHIIRFDEND